MRGWPQRTPSSSARNAGGGRFIRFQMQGCPQHTPGVYIAVGALIVALAAGCAQLPPNTGVPSFTSLPSGAAVAASITPTPSDAAGPNDTATANNTAVPTSQIAASFKADPQTKTPLPEKTLTASPVAKPLTGKVIVVDPGHNRKYSKAFNTKKVPAGNGKMKPCNSSGTATNAGYAEHAYTWAQTNLLKSELERLGAKVLLTRENDNGLGPCVNIRAGRANDAKANLLISIHADGNNKKTARGFHVIVSTVMAGGSKLERVSKSLGERARSQLEKLTAMPRTNYTGKAALSLRSDIATLNLLKYTPGIMMEMGNMRNATDAKLLKSTSFQKAAAKALANAAVETLR